ncbi:MAG: sodium-dependent transporter [Gammaproteobacteria bacterium]
MTTLNDSLRSKIMTPTTKSALGQWSSGWTFILATTGAAVGLGNIWKFPYVAGANGGGAFVLVYLACIALIGVPLLTAEIMLGRRGRQNPIYSMRNVALESNRSPRWKLAGVLCILSGFFILSYYSVIAGWALSYVIESSLGHFKGATAQQVQEIFSTLTNSPLRLIFWNTIIMMGTVTMVMFGVQKGLERTVRFIFPGLIIILFLLVFYAGTTGYFRQGLAFLFAPNFSTLTANGVLIALGQAFFTLSIAYGTIMTYGAYVPNNVSIAKTSIIIAGADTFIALLAGIAIFPIVFAYGLAPDSGAGLIFQTLPISFGNIHFGTLFATLFFIMLVFTAFTTSISILEPSVAFLIEKYKISRKSAAMFAGGACWLFSFGTIFSFNIWSGYKLFGLTFFEIIDYLTVNIMLPLGGLLITVFVGWRMKKKFILSELKLKDPLSYKGFIFCLKIITPLAIVSIFLNLTGMI